jgi:hypothetical protein
VKRTFHFIGAIAGVLLALGPLFYIVFGYLRMFSVLGRSGLQDPQKLSGAIGDVLLGSVSLFVVVPLGATLAAYFIVKLLNAPKAPPPLPKR